MFEAKSQTPSPFIILQEDIVFNYTFSLYGSHRSKTTRSEHMETFYKTFPEVKDEYLMG